MKIVIACGSMPFGPATPQYRSLGGSEAAALMLGKALAARGHEVSMCCNLPPQGSPDFFPGGKHTDGVTYHPISAYASYATNFPHDLLIAVRDPRFVSIPTLSKKRVLWMHDIATKKGMQRALDQMAWAVDELWTVSEWHRQQVHATTGYPLAFIKALRNGIVPVEDVMQGQRIEKQLIYAARPERGLENLIKPGGVMEHLPEYKLKVAMYAHFPEEMRGYYEMLFKRMQEMPNVEMMGEKSQPQLRQIIAESAAYIYPTQFEETSCILARECIEQQTPFFTTREGALPETLGDCGIYFENWIEGRGFDTPEKGSSDWCKLFAQFFREEIADQFLLYRKTEAMLARTDLYWDGVAEMVEANAEPVPAKLFSQLWSLIQDGDVMPARALARSHMAEVFCSGGMLSEPMVRTMDELFGVYSFIEGDMAKYYEDSYTKKQGTEEDELIFRLDGNRTPRWNAIRDQIAALPPGSRVLEYGCGAGHVIAPLAKEFPLLSFVGVDYSDSAVAIINAGAEKERLFNLHAEPVFNFDEPPFDAVICSEVLEHVTEPWKLLGDVEAMVRQGGRVIVTVPFGAWEPQSYQRPGHWNERFHLWCIDQPMMKEMTGDKPDQRFLRFSVGMDRHMRPFGNMVMTYNADHQPIKTIDALAKAKRHWSRQTLAACVIAYNNEDTILRMLNSLENKVQFVQIALGPSTDKTKSLVVDWFAQHPWVRYKIIDVPKIEPWKYGFDDARNASFDGISEDFDWFLWIDTDEYLAGEPNRYLLNSALDGYMVAQHHFTVEPRGKAPEIDRPARLLRASRGYKAKGHIHEHFEVPADGPGMCQLLPDIDIGHVGYVNEEVRRRRFARNFPFLEWDHQTEGKERKLHHFLWFRDIIHRMRFIGMQGQSAEVVKLANEAVSYYNEHTEDMAAFGPGLYMSLTYLSEAYAVLGKGVPLKVAIGFDDRGTQIEGRFENVEQVFRVLRQLLDPEFKDRTSRYYG